MSDLTSTSPQTVLSKKYSLRTRIIWITISLIAGIIIAGFWNYKIVDNFGRNIVTNNTIGETSLLAGSFQENGFGFGIIFALIAGLAATFTACNCVIYVMIPGLACPSKKGNTSAKATAIWSFLVFVLAIILIGAIYGFYVGLLERRVRSLQYPNNPPASGTSCFFIDWNPFAIMGSYCFWFL